MNKDDKLIFEAYYPNDLDDEISLITKDDITYKVGDIVKLTDSMIYDYRLQCKIGKIVKITKRANLYSYSGIVLKIIQNGSQRDIGVGTGYIEPLPKSFKELGDKDKETGIDLLDI
jgi:hypothetical protein